MSHMRKWFGRFSSSPAPGDKPPTPTPSIPSHSRDASLEDSAGQAMEVDTHRESTPENAVALIPLAVQCKLSIAKVAADLVPVPRIGLLVKPLMAVFPVVERTKANKEQWKVLQGRCVMVLRLAGSQVMNNGQQYYPRLDEATQILKSTLEKIQRRAQYYNEMNEVLAFFNHQLISEEIQGLFGELDECLRMFSFAADVTQAQWIGEFRAVQEQAARDIRQLQNEPTKMNVNSGEINQKEDQILERTEKVSDSSQDIASSPTDKTRITWNMADRDSDLISDSRAEANDTALSDPVDTESASRAEDGDELEAISVQGAFDFLISRGCPDLSMRMDVNQQDTMIVNGGGFGNIWMAKLCDGSIVSIKTWRASTVDECEQKTLMRALREIHAWSQMKHQNIHQLIGVIMFKGLIGMVSEWMENGNLREYMLKHPQLDRYQMCVQIANGLAYMHRCNTVHGDLKAVNILVSPKGVAMLTDFGSSVMTEASLEYSITNTTLSVRWAAPEQLDGSPKSKESDIYALGMTMLEIFTGNVPYSECRGEIQVINMIGRGTLPLRPMKLFKDDDYGNSIWRLLESCWNPKPSARPPARHVHGLLDTIFTMG